MLFEVNSEIFANNFEIFASNFEILASNRLLLEVNFEFFASNFELFVSNPMLFEVKNSPRLEQSVPGFTQAAMFPKRVIALCGDCVPSVRLM